MGRFEDYHRTAAAYAERLGVPASALPTRDLPAIEGLFVRESATGLELLYTERGQQRVIASGSPDELVYVVIRDLTGAQAQSWELHHRRRGEDSRRQWMADHVQRMAALSPEWGERVREEYRLVLAVHPFDDQLARRAERWSELMDQGIPRAEAVARAEREFPSE